MPPILLSIVLPFVTSFGGDMDFNVLGSLCFSFLACNHQSELVPHVILCVEKGQEQKFNLLEYLT